MRYPNDPNTSIDDVTLPPESLAKLIDMVTDKTIGASTGKTVLTELLKNGGDPAQIVREKNPLQMTDVNAIQEIVTKILNDNPKEVDEFNTSKETLFQWFMVQVARETKGKADPNVAKELMVKGLEERKK